MRILPRMRGRDLYGGILLPAERKGVLQRLRPRGEGDRRGTGDAAASGGNEIEEGRPSAARFLCDPISFSLPEKETVSPAKGKEGKVRTAVLNLAQNILVFSCPPCQTLPPERALRSAHRGVRRSQLHSTSVEATKAPYSLAPSSFPNCDRCAGSQFGDTGALPVLHGPLSFLGRLKPFFTFWQRKKRMVSKKLPQSVRSADSPLLVEGAFSFFEKWARGDTGRHRGLLQGTGKCVRMLSSKKKKSPAGGQPAGLFSWKGGNRFGRRKVGQQRFCGNDARTAT